MTRSVVSFVRCGVTAALVSVLLAACAVGNTATVSLTRSTTIGQELIDLKKAHDDGVIGDSDYAKAKDAILSQANWQEFAQQKNR